MNRIHFIRACWSDIILLESQGKYALIDIQQRPDENTNHIIQEAIPANIDADIGSVALK